jgi:serine/threonine protein kinase
LVNSPFSQSNILVDAKGIPRLSGYGLSSITRKIHSNHESTVRYCAPELLMTNGVVMMKKKPTTKSDVYSLSMVIVEVCMNPPIIKALIFFSPSLPPEGPRFMIPWIQMSSKWSQKAGGHESLVALTLQASPQRSGRWPKKPGMKKRESDRRSRTFYRISSRSPTLVSATTKHNLVFIKSEQVAVEVTTRQSVFWKILRGMFA